MRTPTRIIAVALLLSLVTWRPAGATLLSPLLAAPRVTADAPDVFGYGSAFVRALKKLSSLTPEQFRRRFAKTRYLDKLSFDPTKAKFFDQFQKKGWKLNARELDLFRDNGFVVSERFGARTFAEIYYNIFTADLPVFISADSLLHAWHRSYDAVLEQLEQTILSQTLLEILDGMSQAIGEADRLYGTGVLRQSLRDADYFLAVARSLLSGKQLPSLFPESKTRVQATLAAVKGKALQRFVLFGKERKIDFSQFKPRGHYEKTVFLRRYFRAMTWLGRIDLRVSGDDRTDYRRQLGSALVLHDLLRRSKRFDQWAAFDRLLQTLVGRTDSMTFAQLGLLLRLSKVSSLRAVSLETLGSLQKKLASSKLGTQQIMSHYFESMPFDREQTVLPRSFTVMGQRFTVDSWATNQVVADRILWKGRKVQRRLPSALDVAFAVFANDHVAEWIARRILDRKGLRFRDGELYQHNLTAVRQVLDSLPRRVWTENVYMHWLYTLRALSRPAKGRSLPQVMRTKAWAMRTLNTQLASWTQLRHDTILYVKQSYTSGAGCYYPAGFVEPRVEFWRRFEAMALATAALLEKTPYPKNLDSGVQIGDLRTRHVKFFRHFAKTLGLLRAVAEKQLAQKPLSADESKILDNVIQIRHMSGATLYNGWYPTLFYSGKHDAGKYDALVADVHTDVPAPILGDPGGVLHQGVGRIDLALIAIDNGKDRVVYAGPMASHYEFVTKGMTRKSDSEWQSDLQKKKTPPRPVWTQSYLVPR